MHRAAALTLLAPSTCVQETDLCFTLIRAAAACDPFSRTSMCLITGFIALRWLVGWMGGSSTLLSAVAACLEE